MVLSYTKLASKLDISLVFS